MRRGIGSGEKLSNTQHPGGERGNSANAGPITLEKSLNSTSGAVGGANQNAPQDLNMSGLSNLSGFGTQNKKMMKLFD